MLYILFFHTKLWKSSTCFMLMVCINLDKLRPKLQYPHEVTVWQPTSRCSEATWRPKHPNSGIFLNGNLHDFSHPSDPYQGPTMVQNVGKPKSVIALKELSQSSKNLNSESTATRLDLPQTALACEGFWNRAEVRLSTVLGKVSDPVSIWPSQSLQQWPHTSFSPRSKLRPCPQAWAGAHMLAWNLICLGHGTS